MWGCLCASLSVCFSKHVHHAELSEHDLALPDLTRPVTSIQKTHFSARVCVYVFNLVCIRNGRPCHELIMETFVCYNTFSCLFVTGLHDLEHPDVALADEW